MKFVEFYNKNENIKSLGFSKVFLSKGEILAKAQKFFGKNFFICKKFVTSLLESYNNSYKDLA